MSTLAPLLQSFFTDRLIGQRRCSRHTITGYRTTFRLLLVFASDRTGKTPSALDIAELDAPLIGAFLDHLENQRGNQARTRNNRLAAIHSLFSYAALRHPEHGATIQRVLAIPTKRCDRNLVTWLTEAEVDALLSAPDRATWTGRRDHAMLVLAAQTGLRISELTGLTIADIHLDTAGYVHCFGKDRKERATPLTPLTVRVLRVWIAERGGRPIDPLFPTVTGRRLSHDAVEHRLARHLVIARATCSLTADETGWDAYSSAFDGHAIVGIGNGRHRDCALARSRAALDHSQHLPARRHDPERTSDRPRHATRHDARPLPTPDTLLAFLEKL